MELQHGQSSPSCLREAQGSLGFSQPKSTIRDLTEQYQSIGLRSGQWLNAGRAHVPGRLAQNLNPPGKLPRFSKHSRDSKKRNTASGIFLIEAPESSPPHSWVPRAPPRTLTKIQLCSSHGPVPLWAESLLSLSLDAPSRSWLGLHSVRSARLGGDRPSHTPPAQLTRLLQATRPLPSPCCSHNSGCTPVWGPSS